MANALEINGRVPYLLIGQTSVGKSEGNGCLRRFKERGVRDLHTTTYTSAERMSIAITQDEIQAALPTYNQIVGQSDPASPKNIFYKPIEAFTLNPTWASVGWQSFDTLSEGGKKTVEDIRRRLGYDPGSMAGKSFIFLDMISAEVAGQSDFDSMLQRYVTTNADAVFDLGLVLGVVFDTTDPSTVPASRVKNDLVKMGLDAGLGDGTYDELSRNGKLIHIIYENKADLPSRVTPEARDGLKKTLDTPHYHHVSFKTDAHDRVMSYLLTQPIIAYNNNASLGGWL